MTLSIQNISKQYNKKLPIVLSDFSLEVASGGVLAIVGPAGAGKSTLMEILAAKIKPTAGVCRVDGVNIHKKRKKFLQNVGYVPQDSQDNFKVSRSRRAMHSTLTNFPPDWTAPRLLGEIAYIKALGGVGSPGKNYAKQAIDEALERFGLADAKGVPLLGYSVGMYRRLSMLLELFANPGVIILDEPFTGLDPVIRENLSVYLKDLAKTRIVLFSTDIINDIESMATHLAVMDKGKLIFSGTTAEFTKDTDGDLFEAYFRLLGIRAIKL
ncbi:MAG: ABC transporter ATP-binding protein [Oscillospiraceae bacterium]|nr:ABC transporter ATP-binding protein [Oscillospiraceae bacterium]